MPQLETSTFFSQFFWTILCLFLLYFYIHKHILPQITRLSKYRSKKNIAQNQSSPSLSHNLQISLQESDPISEKIELTSLDSNPVRQKQACVTLIHYAMEKCASTLRRVRLYEQFFLLEVSACKYIKDIRKVKNKGHNDLNSRAFLSQPQIWKIRLNEIFQRQEWDKALSTHVQKIENEISLNLKASETKAENNLNSTKNRLRRYNSILLKRNYNNAQLGYISRIPLSPITFKHKEIY